MKRFSPIVVLLLILTTLCVVMAQKKPAAKSPTGKSTAKPAAKPPARPKGYVIQGPVLPPKVIEVETWTPFSSAKEKFKIAFPKAPEETVKVDNEFDIVNVLVTSTQSYVNGNLYMVNVRHYPKDFLPARMDLGEHYAAWLRRFIKDEDVISLKRLNYGDYVGYEFVYRQIPSDVVVFHAFVIGDRLYQIVMYMESSFILLSLWMIWLGTGLLILSKGIGRQ